MIALVLSLLFANPERGFADTLRSMAEHTKCEPRHVLKTKEDNARIVFFVCPDARLAVVFQKTPEGEWKPLGDVFSAPLAMPDGSTI